MEENQGIMSLPMGNEPMPAPAQGPQLFSPEQSSAIDFARSQSRPNEVSQEIFKALEQADPALVLEIRQELAGAQLPPEIVEALKTMIDEILANPAGYQELRAELLSDPETAGIFEDLLPPTFDISFFTSFRVVLDQLPSSPATGIMGSSPAVSGMGMLPGMGGMPVQGFAQGGIAELKPIAQALSQMGRNGDTMLAHITPQEAMMLRRMGGSGTINPYTGLPEYFFKKIVNIVTAPFKAVAQVVSNTVKTVGNVVKKIAASPIGRIALTIAAVYFMGPAGFNLAANIGITNAALAVGVNTFAGSTVVNLASGMKPGDALKDGLVKGLTAGVSTGITQGFDAVAPTGVPTPAPIEDAVARANAAAAAETAVAPGLPVDLSSGVQATPLAPNVYTPTDVSAAVAPPSIQYVNPNTNLITEMAVQSPGPLPTVSDAQYQDILSGTRNLGPGGIQVAGAPPGTLSGGSPSLLELGNIGEGVPTVTNLNFTGPTSSFDPRLAAGNIGEGVPTVTNLNDFSLLEQGNIGEGVPTPSIYNRATGALSRGYEGAKDVYSDYISPNRGMPTPEDISTRAKAIRLADGVSADKAYDLATKQLTPSMISQYAPLAGVGLGAAYLGGAFTPEAPPEPNLIKGPTGIDLYQANPEQYRPNIYAGQTPVTYQEFNPALYRQQQYGAYDPFFFQPRSQYTLQQPVRRAEGGITETSKFKRKMGAINGPGTEKSDDIPAMLSDGEFVFTARAVRGMGNGSRRKGAKEMYRLMKMLEKKVGSKS